MYPPSLARPLHARQPYRDIYPSFQIPPLPPHSAYSPPSLLSPQSPIGAASVASAVAAPVAISQSTNNNNCNNNASSISTKSVLANERLSSSSSSSSSLSPPTSAFPTQHPLYPTDYRAETKELKSSNEVNGKSVGFKVPSGKEGSLKHRILTRPQEKDSSSGKLKSSSTFNKNNNSSSK